MNNNEQSPINSAVNHSGPNNRVKTGHVRLILEFVLVVLLALSAVYIWNLRSDNVSLNKIITSDNANPQALVQKQTNQIVSAVQALLGSKVPTNEVPVIATVTDASTVQKQAPFFSSAQNGDKVLFYTKNGVVILYRPSNNTIVADGPLTFNK